MINSFHKHVRSLTKRRGAVTLIVTVGLLVLSSLIILFAARYDRLQNKMSANAVRGNQAYDAAEAGLEYGINYLTQNSAAILANPVSGHLATYSNSNVTNVALANGSSFSIVYSNPIANNYQLITITVTGTNDDGTSTRTISQQVQLGSLLTNTTTYALTSKGSVTMSGNATVTNTSYANSIQSASTVSLSGSAQTVGSGGVSSTAGNIRSDILANQSSLSTMSQSDFIANFFGTTSSSAIQNKVAHYYQNTSSTNYSSTLSGMTATSIWIDQTGGTASINGNTTIGSSSNPVLLIVNGNFSLSGNVTIYGFVFVIGTTGITTLSGNTQIIGGMATSDNLSMSGNIQVTFNPTVLTNLKTQSSMAYYAKVPGSWKDF